MTSGAASGGPPPAPRPGRRRRFLGPLGWRLAIAFVAVAVAAVSVLAVLTVVRTRSEVSDLAQQRREDAAAAVVGAVRDAYADGGWTSASLQPAMRLAGAAGIQAEVRDAQGRTVATGGQTPQRGRGGAPMMPWLRPDPGGGPQPRPPGGFDAADPPRLAPVSVDGTNVGTVVLRYPAQGLSGRELRTQNSLARVVLLGAILAAALAVVVAFVVTRFITRPVVALTDAVDRLEAGDRSVRVGQRGAPGELGELARNFDRMADGLERQETLRRALVADVAHELRTPLTVVQGYCEEMVDGMAAPTPERLGMVRDEVLRIGRLVDDLGTLAAADASSVQLDLRPVAFDTIVSDATDLVEPKAAAKGLAIARHVQPVKVAGDAVRLRQILSNLLTNAVKYTPAGGSIDVRLGPDPEDPRFARLEVSDTGLGIGAEELPNVYARFWRGRSAQGVGGSGIGLAVVAELVAAHHGWIGIASTPGRGTSVRVLFPVE